MVSERLSRWLSYLIIWLSLAVGVMIVGGIYSISQQSTANHVLNNQDEQLRLLKQGIDDIRSSRVDAQKNHDAVVCLLNLSRDRQLPPEQRRPITTQLLKDVCSLSDEEVRKVLE